MLFSQYEILKIVQSREKVYKKKYSKLFSEDLLTTSNFIFTENKKSSVFSFGQKDIGQLLMVKEKGRFKAVLISTLEARFFKDYIKKHKPSGMWLLMPSGQPLIGDAPEMTKEVKALLWQVNLFNGNVKALVRDAANTDRANLEHPVLFKRFLTLKTYKDATQKEALQAYLKNSQKEGHHSQYSLLASKAEEIEERYEPLLGLGVFEKQELFNRKFEEREILLSHARDLKKLQELGWDIQEIIRLPLEELSRFFVNIKTVYDLLQTGLTLDAFFRKDHFPVKV